MIVPTVGRVVCYQLLANPDPQAAIVIRVHNDRLVDLVVFPPYGPTIIGVARVILMQDGDPVPNGDYCQWMPYQIGQAAKTEELAKKLSGHKPR